VARARTLRAAVFRILMLGLVCQVALVGVGLALAASGSQSFDLLRTESSTTTGLWDAMQQQRAELGLYLASRDPALIAEHAPPTGRHRAAPRLRAGQPNAPPGSPPGVRWFDVDIPAVIDLFPGSTTRPSRLARRRWPAAPRRSELAADAAWLLADFCPRWWSASSRLSAS
jgi:hypothetical protein